jgi:hypothetical protein
VLKGDSGNVIMVKQMRIVGCGGVKGVIFSYMTGQVINPCLILDWVLSNDTISRNDVGCKLAEVA